MKPLKFISLNLWMGGLLFENIVDFLKSEKPDILALQEVFEPKEATPTLEKRFRAFSALKEELNLPYGVFAPAFFKDVDGKTVESGNAVLSRFPLLQEEVTFFDVGYEAWREDITDFSYVPRNLQHASVSIDGKFLNVFNTQGIWGFDGKDNDRRLQMSRTIAEKVRGKPNNILCGDFNVDITTQSIKNIEKEMTNVFKGKLKTTFNMRHKKDMPKLATAVIDMVFVSKEIKVEKVYTSDADVSDHIPFVVQFTW